MLIAISANAYAQQCQATTKKGTQCKRNAQAGSVYCWQHARMYDNSSQQKSQSKETVETDSTKISKKETEIGTTSTGKTLYQGPRGGIYHISKSGKKVYHKRK